MRKTIVVIASILLVLFLAACKSESAADWQQYQNDSLGISFEHPQSWMIQEANGVITLAGEQEDFDEGLTTGASATIMVATTSDFDGWNDPGDILGLYMDYFEMGRENLEKIGEPEFITIQDQPAGLVSYRGTVLDQSGLFTAVVVINEERIALLLAFDGSDGEQHQETLERVAQSILVYPPGNQVNQ